MTSNETFHKKKSQAKFIGLLILLALLTLFFAFVAPDFSTSVQNPEAEITQIDNS